MADHELFAVIFIFATMFGAYIAMFFEIGGDKALAEVIVRIIDTHNKKKKEKDI